MSRAVVEADKSPKLIPRVIHQTYKSSSIPSNLKVLMHSWRRMNEDWEIRYAATHTVVQGLGML